MTYSIIFKRWCFNLKALSKEFVKLLIESEDVRKYLEIEFLWTKNE